MLKHILTILAVIGLSTPAFAGDTSAGEEISAACQGCHGADGNSLAGMWPSLAGQNPNYLTKQIKDFQSGARKNETMESMVAALDDKDIADIVAYFSSQKLQPAGSEASKETIALGKKAI